MKFTSSTTETVAVYLQAIVPWAHGHQLKGLADFVLAILERQTGNQAALVRGMGNPEAAVKRLSRLTHNERLPPHSLADAVLDYVVRHLPRRGKVRLALDWTIEDGQHLVVLSLVFKGRAVPIFWRAYTAAVLKGRMKQFELALVKRCLTRFRRVVGLRRLILTADRAFAEEALGALLDEFGVEYVIRAKASTKVLWPGAWQQLQTIAFTTNAQRRNLGRIPYCQSGPRTLWVSLSRVKNEAGVWEVWYLISNRWHRAGRMAAEYARRFGCEQGFRDSKRLLGFAHARIADIHAWARFFTLFALALLILMVLATAVLVRRPLDAPQLLRRIASRRTGRCELSLVNAMLKLLQQDKTLLNFLDPTLVFDLEAAIPNVS